MFDRVFEDDRSHLAFELNEITDALTSLQKRARDTASPVLIVNPGQLDKTRRKWLTFVSDPDFVAFGMSFVNTGLLECAGGHLLTLEVIPFDGANASTTVTRSGVAYVVSYPLLLDPDILAIFPSLVAYLIEDMPRGARIGVPVQLTSTKTSDPWCNIPILVLKE